MFDDIMDEFYIDTQAHLEHIEESIMELEKNSSRTELIDDIFRRVHSIKGNAGVLGLMEFHHEGQIFETFLDEIRERKTATPAEMDKMFQGLDMLKGMLASLRGVAPDQGAAEVKTVHTDDEIAAAPDASLATAPIKSEETGLANATASEPKVTPLKNLSTVAGLSEDERNSAKTDSETTFLVFSLAEERYGIEIMNVREIILVETITQVPNTKEFVLGVMNLRDQVIPVFDLRKKLQIVDDRETVEKNIIVIDVDDTTTGLKVDEVTGIITIAKKQVASPDQFSGSITTDCLMGMAKTSEGTIILLDMAELCAADELLF